MTLRFLCLLMLCNQVWAIDRTNRLGLGLSQQFKNSLPAVSLKIQQSRSFAMGLLGAFSTEKDGGGHGLGVKLYRNLFEERNLNFYTSLGAALTRTERGGVGRSGFQVDLSLGSEFSFPGLASLGFSFEFGLCLSKEKDFAVQTSGSKSLLSAIHFYL